MVRISIRARIAAACFFALSGQAFADQHTAGVPAMSSRPGAAYTIYVDVAGFNYTGTWFPDSGTTYTPGATPAVGDLANTATFSAADQQQIKSIWSGIAQNYIGFNVNVTTVDPAVAAGQGGTDAQRQAFYDATPNLMHTVVGSQIRGTGPTAAPWFTGAADGVSPGIGVVSGVQPAGSGDHTNWMFSEAQANGGTVSNGVYIGGVSAHENAHSFGLYHQGDYLGASNSPVNEYGNGDSNTGDGSYVGTIGNAAGRQRVTWRVGDTHPNDIQTIQNDVGQMLATNTAAMATAAGRPSGADLHFINDGIGHSFETATLLAQTGTSVNPALAQGVIVPVSESNPNPIGVNNYTHDWFKFKSAGGVVTLTANDGTEFGLAGAADTGITLRSTMEIFDSSGNPITGNPFATEDSSTLFETYSGSLAAGDYYAEINSFGGHNEITTEGYNPAQYFDMGGYFLTGTGLAAVPEPTLIGPIAFIAIGIFSRRRRAAV